MGRPKKRNREFTIREDIVNDIRNNPDKYGKPQYWFKEPSMKVKQSLITLSKNKPNKTAMTILELAATTGLPLNVIVPRIIDREIDPLDLNLTTKQINVIYPFFNKLLQESITPDDFRKLLNGELCNVQYKVKKNRSIATFFKKLQENGYISSDWQKKLEKMKAFASRDGKPLKASDYSKALPDVHDDNTGMRKELQEIKKLMEEVKKAGE